MKRHILIICALMAGQQVATAGEIKKIIDANGYVMYTNMSSVFKGRIVKRFDSGVISYRNIPRPNLSGRVVKTGKVPTGIISAQVIRPYSAVSVIVTHRLPVVSTEPNIRT